MRFGDSLSNILSSSASPLSFFHASIHTISINFQTFHSLLFCCYTMRVFTLFYPPHQPSPLEIHTTSPIDFTSDGPSHSCEDPVRLPVSSRSVGPGFERRGQYGVTETWNAMSELRPQLWHPRTPAAHQQQGGKRSRQDCLVEGRGYPP